jgi:hypothetical protein
MISHQRRHAIRLSQFYDPLKDASRIGSTINVIAEKDEVVASSQLDCAEQCIKMRQATVNVTDGKNACGHRVSFRIGTLVD